METTFKYPSTSNLSCIVHFLYNYIKFSACELYEQKGNEHYEFLSCNNVFFKVDLDGSIKRWKIDIPDANKMIFFSLEPKKFSLDKSKCSTKSFNLAYVNKHYFEFSGEHCNWTGL